ncbi:hypothetical protein DIPPA_03373 [Diplonema papillatum]|nr:hypothetical protein DIPPA_05707 [Diplonema papillatum]KAJ9465234.1 hypothetical protein DIPPA_03373 [Diplonema papillatum]
MKDDDKPRKKQLLTVQALAKLLYEWQPRGTSKPVSLATCKKLVEVQSLRAPLEYIVLHTATGEKAREMRLNLRMFFHKDAEAAGDEKVAAQLQRLEARNAELSHLIGETRKVVEKAAADAHQSRCTADQAAVEREVQLQRVRSIRCQKLLFRALEAHAATHSGQLSSSVQCMHALRVDNDDSKKAAETAAVVANTLAKLRQLLGENSDAKAVSSGLPKIPLQQPVLVTSASQINNAAVGSALSELNSVKPVHGATVTSTLRESLLSSISEMRTMSRRDVPSEGGDELTKLVAAGQCSHMKLFVEQERLKKRVADVRREAGTVCSRILARADHQNPLNRQLTEVQARLCGAEAQKRVLVQHLADLTSAGQAKGPTGLQSNRKRMILQQKQPLVHTLTERRNEKLELASQMVGLITERLQVTTGTPQKEKSPLRPAKESLVAHAAAVKQHVARACEIPAAFQKTNGQPTFSRLLSLLPGTANRLLDGIAFVSTKTPADEDSPVHSLEHSLAWLQKLVQERAGLKCRELDALSSLREEMIACSGVEEQASAAKNSRLGCISALEARAGQIQQARALVDSLQSDFSALSEATAHLREQPAFKIFNELGEAAY